MRRTRAELREAIGKLRDANTLENYSEIRSLRRAVAAIDTEEEEVKERARKAQDKARQREKERIAGWV